MTKPMGKRLLRWMVIGCVILSCAACNLMLQNTDPESALAHAVSGISGKDNFAFNANTVVKGSGQTLLRDLHFEGFVVNHNQMYIRTVMRQGLPREAGNKAQNKAQIAKGSLFIKNQQSWQAADEEKFAYADFLRTWNPVIKLEQIIKVKKKVTLNSQQSNGDVAVLDIGTDPSLIRSIVESEIRSQHKQLSVDKLMQSVNIDKLSEPTVLKMREEMKRKVAQAEHRLTEMLQSLSVDSSYRLWINRTSNLPTKMEVRTRMNYSAEGQNREETIKATYVFKDYDKNFIIPR